MRKNIRHRATQLLIASAAFVVTPAAFADYECSKKETEPTPAQKELFSKAALAIRAAFLPPPEGWTMRTPDIRTGGGKFCVDFKNDPVAFGASASYQIKPTADALRKYRQAQAAQRAELDALKVLPPDVQSKIDAIDEQVKALRTEVREAERAKNRDVAKAKSDEVQDLNRKAYAIRSEYTTKMAPQDRAIYKKYEKDMELNRDIYVNVSLEANAAPAATDARTERVVLGNATAKTNQSTDKLVRISVNFEKNEKLTPAQFETVKKLVDRAKLQAMIAGNIPPVEDSKSAMMALNEAIKLADTKAREVERMVENEAREATQAARAAQVTTKQGSDEEKAKTAAATKPETPSTPASKPDGTATTATAPPKPATPPASTPPAAPATSPADSVKDAKEAVNKLRGLFGR